MQVASLQTQFLSRCTPLLSFEERNYVPSRIWRHSLGSCDAVLYGQACRSCVCEGCSCNSGDGRVHDLCNESSAVYVCAAPVCTYKVGKGKTIVTPLKFWAKGIARTSRYYMYMML